MKVMVRSWKWHPGVQMKEVLFTNLEGSEGHLEYYSVSNGEPDEDAYDMRKALSRDTEKKSIIPLPHPVRPEDIE